MPFKTLPMTFMIKEGHRFKNGIIVTYRMINSLLENFEPVPIRVTGMDMNYFFSTGKVKANTFNAGEIDERVISLDTPKKMSIIYKGRINKETMDLLSKRIAVAEPFIKILKSHKEINTANGKEIRIIDELKLVALDIKRRI